MAPGRSPDRFDVFEWIARDDFDPEKEHAITTLLEWFNLQKAADGLSAVSGEPYRRFRAARAELMRRSPPSHARWFNR